MLIALVYECVGLQYWLHKFRFVRTIFVKCLGFCCRVKSVTEGAFCWNGFKHLPDGCIFEDCFCTCRLLWHIAVAL